MEVQPFAIMRTDAFLFVLSGFSLLFAPTLAAVEYFDALAALTTAWPVPGQTANESLIGPFGPGFYRNPVANITIPYNWHRAIDIEGPLNEPIVASFAGTVVKVQTIASHGGIVVVLEHEFGQSVKFHDLEVTKFYTSYFPLESSSVQEGDSVDTGQEIGTMGNAGNTKHVHLHHVLLVGTQCSLDSACNELGVDPHVNPILIYPESVVGPSALTASLQQRVGGNQDGIVLIQGPASRPDANRFVTQVAHDNDDGGKTTILVEHILDLNLREGFDATSNAALGTQDKSKPFLDPVEYLSSPQTTTMYTTKLVIPHEYVMPENATRVAVKVYNVMNVKVGTVVLCRGEGGKRCNRMYG